MDWCPYGKASSGTKRRYICEPLREHHSGGEFMKNPDANLAKAATVYGEKHG